MEDRPTAFIEAGGGRQIPRTEKEAVAMADVIEFSEWKKLDIRVGAIIRAEDHPDADKLTLLRVDVGEERQIVAGLRGYYRSEDLVGKKVVVFVNLRSAKLRGVESRGMVLAAVDAEEDIVSLLTVDRDAPNGARIE